MKSLFVGAVFVLGMSLVGGSARAQAPVIAGAGAASAMGKAIAYQTGLQRGLVQAGTLNLIRMNPAVRLNPVANILTSPTSAALGAGTTAAHEFGRGAQNYLAGNTIGGELHHSVAAHATGISQAHSLNASLAPSPASSAVLLPLSAAAAPLTVGATPLSLVPMPF